PGAQAAHRTAHGFQVAPHGIPGHDGPPQAQGATQALGPIGVGGARRDLDVHEAATLGLLEQPRDFEARDAELACDVELGGVVEVVAAQYRLDHGVGCGCVGHLSPFPSCAQMSVWTFGYGLRLDDTGGLTEVTSPHARSSEL